MSLLQQAHVVLEATSRTFMIPIMGLPSGLHEAVMSGYLCLRAIDEIEDHPELPEPVKQHLLHGVSRLLQSDAPARDFDEFFASEPRLPEVTARLHDWIALAPLGIAPRIGDVTAAMADRMAIWSARRWNIGTVADLDWYTFSVAGAVGLLLSDLWAWYDGTTTARSKAVGFGRGLQATNILLNRTADLNRGVDFFPPDWTGADMRDYAAANLRLADAYEKDLPDGPVRSFCRIPLTLAWASLDAWDQGRPKLTRDEVNQVVRSC